MAWDDEPPKKGELVKVPEAWDAEPPRKDELKKNSPWASGLRKFVAGASADFSDELAGATESAGKVLGLRGLGGPMKDIERDKEGPSIDWDKLKASYRSGRDKERDTLKKDALDNPGISTAAELGGAVMSPLNKLIPTGASAAKTGVVLGGAQGLGASDGETVADNIESALKGAAIGGGIGRAGGYLSKALPKAGQKLGESAEKLAENATGATGKQSAKFQDRAGRELLDRKLVRFGDNAENVAERVGGAVDDANGAIDKALTGLDAKGATANADNVVSNLQGQIESLKKDPSKSGMVKKLQGIVDNIIETGESTIPLSRGEQTKRGFRKAAGNWMDPEAGEAGKKAYLSYRDEVERAAEAADPALSKLFKSGKDTYGLLSPIQEAAEKRAATLNQSPFGGLLDVASAGAGGAAIGGPVGLLTGAGGALARRSLAPRISSSAAVTLDRISKQLMKTPKMARLAQKNPAEFQALVTKLAQQDDNKTANKDD